MTATSDTLVDQARELFDDLDGFAAALASRTLLPAGRAVIDGSIQQAGLTAEERQLVDHGRQAISRLARGVAAAALSPEEVVGLQLVLYLTVRPALRVLERGVVGPFPREWTSLEHTGGVIGSSIRGTVRIDLAGRHRGTGFAVGRATVLTNQHVVSEVATQKGLAWTPKAGVTVDFIAEGGVVQARYRVIAVDGVHPTLDVGVLVLDIAAPVQAPSGFEVPMPLLFAPTSRPSGTAVVAVGCPGKPGPIHGYPSDVLWRLFDNTFSVKRVSPGALRKIDETNRIVSHDCTTLGGSSGSPLIDLDDGLVVGVHFWGEAGTENRAVLPSPADPFFQRHVSFA